MMGDSSPDTRPLPSQSQQDTLSSKRTRRLVLTRSGAAVARPCGSHCRGWAESEFRRVRTARATRDQIKKLLAALETQPFLVTRRFTSVQGKENYDIAWKKVAADLNNTINGAVKTPDQWLTVWRDLKSRTCIKAAKMKEQIKTGNTTPDLTVVEQRIVSIVGAAKGTPDSMPEEDELQRELEADIQIEYVNVNSDEVSNDGLVNIEMFDAKPEVAEIEDSGSEVETNAATTTTEHEVQVQPRRNRNLNLRRSVDEQHNSARSDFLAVAQSNAESMQIIASAAKQQAEAAKQQSEAAKLQAEASVLFAQALNKMADALLAGRQK